MSVRGAVCKWCQYFSEPDFKTSVHSVNISVSKTNASKDHECQYSVSVAASDGECHLHQILIGQSSDLHIWPCQCGLQYDQCSPWAVLGFLFLLSSSVAVSSSVYMTLPSAVSVDHILMDQLKLTVTVRMQWPTSPLQCITQRSVGCSSTQSSNGFIMISLAVKGSWMPKPVRLSKAIQCHVFFQWELQWSSSDP